jgi:hypothetical protein
MPAPLTQKVLVSVRPELKPVSANSGDNVKVRSHQNPKSATALTMIATDKSMTLHNAAKIAIIIKHDHVIPALLALRALAFAAKDAKPASITNGRVYVMHKSCPQMRSATIA